MVSLKTTWENIHFERQNHFAWVFIEGRMFVIGEAAHDQDLKDNFNKKTFYVGTNIKRRKRSAK